MSTKTFSPYALPDNEGAIIVFEGQWLEHIKLTYVLKDDSPLGDTCSDKWFAFRDFLKSGGDSDYLFKLTFDKVESRPAASSTITLIGKVKNMTRRVVAGRDNIMIQGEFEFWLSDE